MITVSALSASGPPDDLAAVGVPVLAGSGDGGPLLAGVPAISIPAGLDANGLPLGLQIIGKPFEEDTVFAVAGEMERSAGFTALPLLRAGG